jgi:hypothetical protein
MIGVMVTAVERGGGGEGTSGLGKRLNPMPVSPASHLASGWRGLGRDSQPGRVPTRWSGRPS